MRGATITATVDGITHNIPESWIAGFCRGQGGLGQLTAKDAIRHWHEQWKLEQTTAGRKDATRLDQP